MTKKSKLKSDLAQIKRREPNEGIVRGVAKIAVAARARQTREAMERTISEYPVAQAMPGIRNLH